MISAGWLGLLVFLGLAWLLSENRRRFPWRTVVAGLGLQVLFGWLILRTDAGRVFFSGLDRAFRVLLGFAEQGTAMVFGPLADAELLRERLGEGQAEAPLVVRSWLAVMTRSELLSLMVGGIAAAHLLTP